MLRGHNPTQPKWRGLCTPLDQLCSMDSKTANIIETRLGELRVDALKAFKMQVMRIYSSANHPAFVPDSMVSEAVMNRAGFAGG